MYRAIIFDMGKVLIDFDQYLVKDTSGKLVAPDSGMTVIPTQPCAFDPNSHTFMNDPNSWQISSTGLSLIKQQEGFAKSIGPDMCVAYLDPSGVPGLYAIGYGTTQAALGMPIVQGVPISRSTADQYLQTCIDNVFMPALKTHVTVGLTQNMIDALMDWMYNLGVPNFSGSTMLKQINAKQWCAAGDAMVVWNMSNHVVLPVLTRRRQKERVLFLT